MGRRGRTRTCHALSLRDARRGDACVALKGGEATSRPDRDLTNKVAEVSEVSMALKRLAKDLD